MIFCFQFRCKLAAFISQEVSFRGESSENYGQNSASPVLTYLMSVPPSSIDVEFRALCLNEEDEEGLELLGFVLISLTNNLKSGRHFEVLQAYLHRFLSIYAEYIMRTPELSEKLVELKAVHALYAEKFRHIVQSNLCVLKILSQLPTI